MGGPILMPDHLLVVWGKTWTPVPKHHLLKWQVEWKTCAFLHKLVHTYFSSQSLQFSVRSWDYGFAGPLVGFYNFLLLFFNVCVCITFCDLPLLKNNMLRFSANKVIRATLHEQGRGFPIDISTDSTQAWYFLFDPTQDVYVMTSFNWGKIFRRSLTEETRLNREKVISIVFDGKFFFDREAFRPRSVSTEKVISNLFDLGKLFQLKLIPGFSWSFFVFECGDSCCDFARLMLRLMLRLFLTDEKCFDQVWPKKPVWTEKNLFRLCNSLCNSFCDLCDSFSRDSFCDLRGPMLRLCATHIATFYRSCFARKWLSICARGVVFSSEKNWCLEGPFLREFFKIKIFICKHQS